MQIDFTSTDFHPQEPTPLRMQHMIETLGRSADPEATIIAYALSGRDYPEAMFIADTLLTHWSEWREQRRQQGLEPPPYIHPAHVRDPVYTQFLDQVPPCCKNYFVYRVDSVQQDKDLNAKQLELLGAAEGPLFGEDQRTPLVAMMGEERAALVERKCSRLPSPADFARLLINLSLGDTPPFNLAAARTREVQSHFDYCLNPAARSTADNVRDWIDKICLQRGLPVQLSRKPPQRHK